MLSHLEAKKKYPGRWPVAVTQQFQRSVQQGTLTRRFTNAPGIYVIYSHDNWYKIGKTKDSILKRINNLQVGNPQSLELIAFIPCQEINTREIELHTKFSAKRGNGEWFRLEEADVTWLKELGGMAL
jgi:hypothetical protein